MKENKTLHLNLKKEWFDKIASGEKTIEYREVKGYWITRLTHADDYFLLHELRNNSNIPNLLYKEFDEICFKNGYGKNFPKIIVKYIKTEIILNGMETDLKIDNPVFAIHFEDITI